MKPLTREWVQKAEADWVTAQREWRARKSPNYDAACFHAQQCAEKYLKARLTEADLDFKKTHDLMALLDCVLAVEPLWEACRRDLAYLAEFAVSFRYPGESATTEQSRDAIRRCRRFRSTARQSLNLA